jgi:hypothetical protein
MTGSDAGEDACTVLHAHSLTGPLGFSGSSIQLAYAMQWQLTWAKAKTWQGLCLFAMGSFMLQFQTLHPEMN